MRISDWSSDVCSSDLAPPPVPLDAIVRDVVENVSAAAKAEMALIEARGSLAWHAIKWTSAWGFIAACALLVAMLAVAFGAIMVLAPHVGPPAAQRIVFSTEERRCGEECVGVCGSRGWQSHDKKKH